MGRTIRAMLAVVGVSGLMAIAPALASANTVVPPGTTLPDGGSVTSGTHTLAMQTDGNLVLYNGAQSRWQSHTYPNPGARAVMQTDGNLVVYSAANQALFQSGTYNNPGAYLDVQDDGNVVIYASDGHPLWATNTVDGDARAQGAVAWETAHSGSTAYNELCETAVERAYNTIGRYPSARANYLARLQDGTLHSETDSYHSTAPAGALVFFNGSDPALGHVGIAVGDGSHYWTTDGTIHVAPLTEGDGYLGWAPAPANW
jgi:hypothetical protein